MSKETETWSVASAKARFSEVVERARRDGPQFVTRNGRDFAVLGLRLLDPWDGRA